MSIKELTNADLREIKGSQEMKISEICRIYNISYDEVLNIINNPEFKYIKKDKIITDVYFKYLREGEYILIQDIFSLDMLRDIKKPWKISFTKIQKNYILVKLKNMYKLIRYRGLVYRVILFEELKELIKVTRTI